MQPVRLHDLGLAVDDEAQGAVEGHQRQRLERRVQRQTSHDHATSRARAETLRARAIPGF